MASVTRRLAVAACSGQRIDKESGEFVDFVDVMVGHPDNARATRYFRRKHHDSTITVNNVEIDEQTYKMEAMDFIAHATIVSQAKEN